MNLFLASTSPARLALLKQVGIEPIVIPSDVDELAVVDTLENAAGRTLSTEELVAELAKAKAQAVTAPGRDGIIIGGDSAFLIDGVTHGKPHEPAVALQRWRAQRGQTGQLWSGLHLIDHRGGSVQKEKTLVTSTMVTFAEDISDDEIDVYVATGEPLLVAGAFTIDGGAAPFIDRIEGDPSTVIGMSLISLRRGLREFDVRLDSLRNSTNL